jgi:hypothetical protein
VTVKIKYADFRQATRSRTLPAFVTSQDALRDVSIGLVRTVFPPAKGIRLVGVTLSSFERPDSTSSKQLELASRATSTITINRKCLFLLLYGAGHAHCAQISATPMLARLPAH